VRVAENVPIAGLTTLRLGGPARRLVTAEREDELIEAVSTADGPVILIGGGSNLVVADEGFAGTTILVATRGVRIEREGDAAIVTVAAGEPWDDLVARLVDEGLSGVECLGGIPGLVGAVPMQNVGAYGQDVSETIIRVRTWDRDARCVREHDREACRFAYRSSVFRGSDRSVILEVTFRLSVSAEARPIRYAELSRALGSDRAPARVVR